MLTLKINDKDYRVKFSYNSFCDTDLFDRVRDMINLLNGNGAEDDSDVAGLGKIKDLFLMVRDLLFVGFHKYNPVESVQEVGDLLDDYADQGEEDEKRGLIDIFGMLAEELMTEGFLSGLAREMNGQAKTTKISSRKNTK